LDICSRFLQSIPPFGVSLYVVVGDHQAEEDGVLLMALALFCCECSAALWELVRWRMFQRKLRTDQLLNCAIVCALALWQGILDPKGLEFWNRVWILYCFPLLGGIRLLLLQARAHSKLVSSSSITSLVKALEKVMLVLLPVRVALWSTLLQAESKFSSWDAEDVARIALVMGLIAIDMYWFARLCN
jgi:H+/Cl- antiporter ClcA